MDTRSPSPPSLPSSSIPGPRIALVETRLLPDSVREVTTAPTVRTAEDAVRYAHPLIAYRAQEVSMALALDTRYRIVSATVVGIGTIDSCGLSPREVFTFALLSGAKSVILAHNHPSGNPTPSREDIAVTERLREAGALLGVEVLDHVVIGFGSYFSIAEGVAHEVPV